jgi:uncharacterized protein (TIGR02246 family)
VARRFTVLLMLIPARRPADLNRQELKMTQRPALALERDPQPVEDFVAGLQAAIDAGDGDLFNRHFAADVLWGSPFGLVVSGYDQIHSIHSQMFAAAKTRQRHDEDGGSRYEIEHARRIADDVAIAYVRRSSLTSRPTEVQPGQPEGFDELALFVLVRRDDTWWLAAGLHTPDRRDVYR